jgi:hypothetical protein
VRVAVDQAPVLEPAEPAAHGLHPPAGVGGEGQGGDQPGDPVGVPGRLAVVDGQLGQALGLVPVGGPPVELGHPPGLAPLQLGQEQLPEQLVVAVPAVAAVHLDQRQLGLGQRRPHPVRPADAEDRVAQGPGQPVEHGRTGEEGHRRLREAVQQAGRHRGGPRLAVARDRRPRGGPPALAGRGRGGQVQPHRPALGPLQQLGHQGVAGPDAGVLQQRPGLLAVHGQLVRPDLQQQAARPGQGLGQRRPGPRGHGQLRPVRQPQRHLGHGVKAVLVGQLLQVVEHQRHRPGHGRQAGHEPRDQAGRGRGARRGQGAEQPRVDRLHPVQGHGQVAEQDHRVVVAPVQRHPGGAAAALGPLGQQGGLAVPGRGGHAQQPGRGRGQQPLQQGCPRHHAPAGPRRMELGLLELERRRHAWKANPAPTAGSTPVAVRLSCCHPGRGADRRAG